MYFKINNTIHVPSIYRFPFCWASKPWQPSGITRITHLPVSPSKEVVWDHLVLLSFRVCCFKCTECSKLWLTGIFFLFHQEKKGRAVKDQGLNTLIYSERFIAACHLSYVIKWWGSQVSCLKSHYCNYLIMECQLTRNRSASTTDPLWPSPSSSRMTSPDALRNLCELSALCFQQGVTSNRKKLDTVRSCFRGWPPHKNIAFQPPQPPPKPVLLTEQLWKWAHV